MGLFAIGCGSSPAPATPAEKAAVCTNQTVKLAMPVTPPNVVHIPPYIAQDMGIFKDEGLTVEIAKFEGGVGAFRAMAGGSVDLAGTSAEPFITAVSQGAEVKAIYTYAPNVDVSFVVRANITSPQDLKGKNIGIQEPGGFADVMSRLVLKKYGIAASDVKFVTTTTAGRVTALIGGTVDTGVLHIDQVKTIAKSNPGIHKLVNMTDVVTDYQYAVFAASNDSLKNNATKMECLVRALIKADRMLYDTSKRQQILDVMVKYTKENPQVVADTYDELVALKAWPQNDGIPKANIDGTAKSLKDSGQIQTVPTFDQLVDLTLAKKIVKQLGAIKNFPY
ncbi:MAG TPA: ABC transporter substrate-binding protein [Candidatus Eisenbacteria bacterium]|nr:ABC transporter substrate-binding protein [Candidatus Eisenbacteria bacterium]